MPIEIQEMASWYQNYVIRLLNRYQTLYSDRPWWQSYQTRLQRLYPFWTPAGNTSSQPQGQTVYGNNRNNTIKTGAGDDTVYARGGNDRVSTGNGNDKVYAGSGNDYVDSGNGDDTVDGGTGNDRIYAGNGNDTIYGGSGSDRLYGGNGNDTIYTGNQRIRRWGSRRQERDVVNAGNGDDTVYSQLGSNTITMGRGNDKLSYAQFTPTSSGITLGFSRGRGYVDKGRQGRYGTYRDTLRDLPETIEGTRQQNDTLDGSESSVRKVNVDLNSGAVIANTSYGKLQFKAIGFENVTGSSGNDVIKGNQSRNNLFGEDGNDELHAYGYGDYLHGGNGSDTFVVDTLTSRDVRVADLDLDKDVVKFTNVYDVDDMNIKAVGNDAAIYMGSELLATINGFGQDSLAFDRQDDGSITIIRDLPEPGLEPIIEDESEALLKAYYADANFLVSTDLSDRLYGFTDKDVLQLGDNNTYARYRELNSPGELSVHNFTGLGRKYDHKARTYSYSADYTLGQRDYRNTDYAYGIDAIKGGSGNDIIMGGWSGKGMVLDGGAGNDEIESSYDQDDLIFGGDGNDYIKGHTGNNIIFGGAGDDFIRAGTGDELVSGGSGSDVFKLAKNQGSMTITDFKVGEDKIIASDNHGINFKMYALGVGDDTHIYWDDQDLMAVVQGVRPDELTSETTVTPGYPNLRTTTFF